MKVNMAQNSNSGMRVVRFAGLLALALVCGIGLLCSFAEAVDVCGDKIYLNITATKECGPTGGAYPGTLSAGCTAPILEETCGMVVYHVCCPIDVIVEYADASRASVTVTNVLLGNEQATADTLWNQFDAGTPYKTPAEGFVVSGYIDGSVWVDEPGTVPGTVNVKWSGFKNGIFKKQGAPGGDLVPVENIGGAAGNFTGGYGVNTDFNFAPSADHNKDLGTSLTQFRNDVLATGAGSMMNVFAGGIPSAYGKSTVVSFNAGSLGSHSFDFSHYATLWATLGSIIMVITSFICVKIIFKGGS